MCAVIRYCVKVVPNKRQTAILRQSKLDISNKQYVASLIAHSTNSLEILTFMPMYYNI